MNFAFFTSTRKTFKYLSLIAFAFLATMTLMLYVYSNNFYTSHSDDFLQYFSIAENFILKLKTGNLSLYSYDTYFGSSFFSDFYYISFDFFTFITLILSYFLRFEFAYALTEMLKLFLGTLLIAYYLKIRGSKNKTIFFVSLIYLVCGYSTLMMVFPGYFSMVFYFPFMALCLEFFIKQKKYWMLLFGVCALVFYNFYIAYLGLIFTGILFVITYIIDNPFLMEKKDIITKYKLDKLENYLIALGKYFYKMGLKGLFCIITILFGVALSLIVLYPNALYILNDTYRNASTQGGVIDDFTFVNFHYFRLWAKLFTPTVSTSFYGFNQSYLIDHHSLYITVTGLVLLLQVFVMNDRKSWIYKIWIVIEGILLIFPIVYMVLSGNTSAYVRWFGIINFFNMLILAHVIDHDEQMSGSYYSLEPDFIKKQKIIPFIIFNLFELICFGLTFMVLKEFNDNNLWIIYFTFIAIFIFVSYLMGCYLDIIKKFKIEIKYRFINQLLIILMLCLMLFIGVFITFNESLEIFDRFIGILGLFNLLFVGYIFFKNIKEPNESLFKIPMFFRNFILICLILFVMNFYINTLYGINLIDIIKMYTKIDLITSLKTGYVFNVSDLVFSGSLKTIWTATAIPSLTQGIINASILDILLMALASTIVITITLFSLQKKINILPYVLTFELILSAGMMFGPKFSIENKFLVATNRDLINNYMDQYLTYDDTFERIYVSPSVNLGEEKNFTKTNLQLSGLRMFHSFMDKNVTTDEAGIIDFIDLLYTANEGQAGRVYANKPSLCINQIIGNHYVVTNSNYDIALPKYYQKIEETETSSYVTYELEGYTPFMIYNEYFDLMPAANKLCREEVLINYMYYGGDLELGIAKAMNSEITSNISNVSTIATLSDWIYEKSEFTNDKPYIYYDLSSYEFSSEAVLNVTMNSVKSFDDIFLVDLDGNKINVIGDNIYLNNQISRIYILNSDSVVKSTKKLTIKQMGYKGYEAFTQRMQDYHNLSLTINNNHLNLSYLRDNPTRSDVLSLPICYNDGWKCVNEEYEVINVNGGFIGIIIPEGEDFIDLELQFVPDGFNESAIVSMGSFIVLGCAIVLYTYTNKKIKKGSVILKKIGIIVPCYNEEASLKMFFEEIIKYIDIKDYKFNLIFINDGSKDQTLDLLKEFSKLDKRVDYISFSRNFGKESAMQAGLKKCLNYDAAIIIDADLQHPPVMILDMIKHWENGYNIVYTRNSSRKGEPFLRTLFAKIFYRTFDKYSDDIRMEQGIKDFQLLDKKVINAFLSLPDHNRFLKGIFSFVGFKKICLPLQYVDRKAGKTTWNFRKLLIYGFNGLNQFSSILKILPKMAFWFVFVVMIAEIVLGIMQYITYEQMAWQIKLDVFMMIILGLFYFTFHLLYSIRSETINRPIYFIEEESDNEMDN